MQLCPVGILLDTLLAACSGLHLIHSFAWPIPCAPLHGRLFDQLRLRQSWSCSLLQGRVQPENVLCPSYTLSVLCDRWPTGTQLWAKVQGFCHWPVVAWSPALCPKADWPSIIETYQPGALSMLLC